VFQKARHQGGVNGYAHAWDSPAFFYGAGHRKGMALDVPFGLVDFVEVLQRGTANINTWFDFLNLGYKLVPAAGTDYPAFDQPGTVRSFVKTGRDFSTPAWFQGLKAGRTFATNGPMLELTLNGHGMGSELQVDSGAPLVVEAKATINPDIDVLDRLELFEQGEVVAKRTSNGGADELQLRHEIKAGHGTWFVLRAYGKKQDPWASVVALSAPIYVRVGPQGFCKPAAVPSIVAGMREQLRAIIPAIASSVEYPDMPKDKSWSLQKASLEQRIKKANAFYDDIVNKANQSRCIESK